jgi:hypothetical protein
MYILFGKKITAVYPMSRRRWDQNTSQVANRLNRARATYVWLLHLPPWFCDQLLWINGYSCTHAFLLRGDPNTSSKFISICIIKIFPTLHEDFNLPLYLPLWLGVRGEMKPIPRTARNRLSSLFLITVWKFRKHSTHEVLHFEKQIKIWYNIPDFYPCALGACNSLIFRGEMLYVLF